MASAPSGPPSSGSAFRAAGGDPTQVALAGVPQLEVGLATDPGKMPEKQVNEDAALARATRFGHLAVVCDGMGGHVGGREASHIAIESIFRVMDQTPTGLPADVLAASIREANASIHARGNALPELKGMGSTCVAVLTHAIGTEVAHVGDSRVYLMTQQQVYQVTKDHSLVQRLVDANMLTPDEAANHPSANQITNALGMKPDVEVEVRPQALPNNAGDVLVLCSDGLSDEIGPQDILNILAPHPPVQVAAQQMVDLANARGGHDNITVVVVRIAGGAPFVPAMPGSAHPTPVGQAPTTTLEMEAQGGAPSVGQGTGQPVGTLSPMGGVPPGATPVQVAPMQVVGGQPVAIASTQMGAPQPVPQFSPPPAFVAQSHALEGEGPPSLREQPARRGGGGAIIFVVLLLVLGAIGGGVYWFVIREHKETTPPPSTTASEEPESTAEPTSSKKPDKTKPKPIDTETEPSTTPSATAEPSTSSSATTKKPPPAFTAKPPPTSNTAKPSDTIKDPGTTTGGPSKHPDDDLPPEMK